MPVCAAVPSHMPSIWPPASSAVSGHLRVSGDFLVFTSALFNKTVAPFLSNPSGVSSLPSGFSVSLADPSSMRPHTPQSFPLLTSSSPIIPIAFRVSKALDWNLCAAWYLLMQPLGTPLILSCTTTLPISHRTIATEAFFKHLPDPTSNRVPPPGPHSASLSFREASLGLPILNSHSIALFHITHSVSA